MSVLLYDVGVYDIDVYGTLQLLPVRERPPLRTTTEITTPNGRRYRWASDEPDPANVPSGERWSDTMPGGFEQYSATLPRKPGVDYADLERLSTVTIRGAGGRVVGEYRLDSVPRSSGDQMAVSPAAVGFQAALEDDKFARVIYRDAELSRWGEPTASMQLARLNSSPPWVPSQWSVSVAPDDSGQAVIVHETARLNTTATERGIAESWYDARGVEIGALYYELVSKGLGNAADANWTTAAVLSNDDLHTTTQTGTDHNGADGPTAATLTASGAAKFFATLQTFYTAVFTDDGQWTTRWRPIVYGQHGLTLRGTEPDAGFYASDVVAHAVQTWAPSLSTVIQQSSFVIPHLAFLEPTTAGEIVRQASRFDLPDWAVWEDRTFWWTERGAQARRWRARIGPSQLEETGPQVDRLWNSIIVQYSDVDGSTRTVGPPGSGADTESTDLKDFDPENPANRAGIVRRDLLQMGTSTAAGATEVGRRFLLESRLLDRSGKARAVGHIEDDRGVLHPYWAPRAGDEIAFVDASDKSYRRIVRTDKDRDTRTVTFDLDAPPEGLSALLERLGVVLVPLGVG